MQTQAHIVRAPGAPEATGLYSQATTAGGLCFVSCQLPVDPSTGVIVRADINIQSQLVLDNVGAVLSAAGSDWTRVLSTTVLLADAGDAARFNLHYADRFPPAGPYPARSIYQAGGLASGALVGVAAVASVDFPAVAAAESSV